MPDPHDGLLKKFYICSIEKAKIYLKARYSLSVYEADDEEISDIKTSLCFRPLEFWKIELQTSSPPFTLIVAVPDTFPDTLPKIYLTKREFQEIYPIPHLDKNRFVCTKDSEVVSLNYKKPGEALDELIKKAASNVEAGIKRENQSEYAEEFLAYWNDNAEHTLSSLFYPTEKASYPKIFRLSPKSFGTDYIISDSEELTSHWLARQGLKMNSQDAMEAVYLPLSELPQKLFEKNQNPILLLKNLNPEHEKILEKYLNQDRSHYFLIASLPLGGERILFGCKHPKEPVNGFRENKVPLKVRLANTNPNRIAKIAIKRLDKERIFLRGGTTNPLIRKNISAALIGCGSIGSFMAMSLARSGISKFLLIDKEELEPENVARHLCGFSDASKGTKKVEAVKKRLTEHFPHIECNTYPGDVLHLLIEQGRTAFDDNDLIIVALGNTAVELRINYFLREQAVKIPVFYLWLEPFAVGGHLLHVSPEEGGCFECCFNEKGTFRYSVTSHDQVFSKREAGCQSSYTPYSSLDAEQFVNAACRSILAGLEEGGNDSKLITWVGNLEAFKALGYRISGMYVTNFPYTVHERKIPPNPRCNLCGKKGKNT